jgi:FKBP-type peptidyl-prolyl cis-trans isomerase (trigger factor)
MNTKKDKRKGAQVSITGTLPAERIEKERARAIARIQKEMILPGFRRGKVPVERVIQEVGEKSLWQEAAEAALKDEAEGLLKEHEVIPVMPIGASLQAAEAGADVPFEIIAIVAPTCSIEGYKENAEKALSRLAKVDEEKEKALALEALRKQARTMSQSEGEGPLTDEEAKKLGLENAAAAELFLIEEAARAFREHELQKKRGAMAETLITKAACDIPHAFIHDEARSLLEATKKDVARQGVPWNDYLKRVGKSEEDVMKDLEGPAEKRVALDIIFGEIARTEKVEPDNKEEERLAHALVSQGVTHDQAHNYIRATMLREKVWELLGAKSESAVS